VFTSPDEVEVNGERISSRRFVLATGASPYVPPMPGLDTITYLTNETIFGLQQLPARLAVVGGGPIGIELAQAFSRLGSEVTVLQRNPTIMPREEPEAAQQLQARLASEGVVFLTSVQVRHIETGDEGIHLIYENKAGREQVLAVDELLLAVGRQPNVEGLNLEAAGVEYGRGRLKLDGRLRTTNPRIYACGDVAGPYQFTHMAEYQAGVVISNAVFRVPKRVDYRVVPWVTYTDPELARVGLSEAEAQEQGIPHAVLRFDFSAIDRAITERETDGFAKFIVRGGSRLRGGGQILGATLLGAHAGELLHEIVLAMQAKVPFSKISATIHAYPTLAQINRRTVNSYYGKRLFSPGTRRVVRWINRFIP
jgi:pyruvate/2-oxoglutarate dehydrogenase complex dihydrolipoamide dehydrogenase (E3) component